MKVSKAMRKQFARMGRKGGKARAEKLSAAERQALARHAAVTRWANTPKPEPLV